MTTQENPFARRTGVRAPVVRRQPHFGTDDASLVTDLIVIPTEDDHKWDGMLFRPRQGAVDSRLAVLIIHGSVGHYLSGMPRRMAFHLAQRGIATLTANTRMANYGVFFGTGLLELAQLDVTAAVRALRERGFQRIVLLGYSMGATMVTHYQAVHAPPQIIGVCTVAHPESLSRSLRRRWERFGSSPSYDEMCAMAQAQLEGTDDPERDRIVIVQRATGPSAGPEDAEIWTYRTWLHSRGPDAHAGQSLRWVGDVTVPLAIIQAAEDPLIRPEEGVRLAQLAREGSCPQVHLESIPGANHTFDGVEDAAADAVHRWISAAT